MFIPHSYAEKDSTPAVLRFPQTLPRRPDVRAVLLFAAEGALYVLLQMPSSDLQVCTKYRRFDYSLSYLWVNFRNWFSHTPPRYSSIVKNFYF